jgi:signal transduction histidine kinase
MLPDPTQGLRRPLFFKLALIFLITSVTVVSSVGAFFYFQRPKGERHREIVHKNVVHYSNYLVDSIGVPPDENKALQLSQELELQVRIEGPNFQWTSSSSLAQLSEVEASDAVNDIPGVFVGRVSAGSCAVVTRGAWKYLLVFPGNPMLSLPLKKILIQLGLICVILILSFLAVKWLLKPMNLLVQGVSEISAGNLDYEITLEGGHDEFKDLANAFNGMTAKVKSMVHAKERLLVDVSHELRSPLARIKVALEMMPMTANQKSISRAASEMEIMLSEILETERLKSSHGALKKAALDLPKLASEVAANYRTQKPGLKILKPKDFPAVMADEAKTRTVLKNVFENSLKYSAEQKKPVEISFGLDASSLRVSVRDFGIGIPDADLPLVFEPFYRVDKSRTKKTGGYGLGLSLCKEIMRAHGGDVQIQSRPKSGTEVTLVFSK